MDYMMRVMLAQAVGGGGGGCGVVLATAYDDNFDCGASIDTAGTRFSGANAWTRFNDSSNVIGMTQAGGALSIETSSNGTSFTQRGAYQTVPSGDWTFEIDVSIPLPGGAVWDLGAGLYLAESSSGKWLCPVFGCNFGNYVAVRRSAGGSYGSTTPSSGAGLLEISRVSGAISSRFYQGGSWTSLMSSVAQTTDFTTAPDRIGIFVANRVASGTNETGTFQYFHRTA